MEARRVVTALFFDTVGSTALGERLDPEDLQLVIGAGVDRMVAAAEAFGGDARSPSGDGGMVLFGAPVAHEDDPERAIRAGLRITEEMAEYSSEVRARWGIEGFGVRVGIETGLVALSAIGGGGGTGAMGDALNTAARLESAAPVGGVLVGERTRRIVEHLFEWDGPHELELKGKQGMVPAWRAVAPIAGAPRRVGTRAPIVGRNAEVGLLLEAMDATLAGEGRVVTLRGEAGMGKSRMLEELRRHFEHGGGTWLEGHAISYGATLTLHPFAELLADVAGGADVFVPDEDVPPPLALERTFASVIELLRATAAAAPVAVVIDDLHWADASSLALAERMLDLPAEAPATVILTSRPVPEHGSAGVLRAARARPFVSAVELTGLARSDEQRLLGSLLADRAMDDALAEQVLDRAGGNPLYLEELVRAVDQAGGDPDAKALPQTIEKLILARVDLLDEPDRALAAAAAVLGRSFELDTLQAVAGSGELDALVESELVEPSATGGYRFRHPLMQEAVYEGLLRRRRQELHGRVAEVLGAQPDAEPALLAQHHAAAGDDDRALDLYLAAAVAAEERGAMAEASAHADAAAQAAERLGLGDGDARLGEALRRRATAGWFSGERDASRAACERALAGASEAGDERGQLAALMLMATFSRMDEGESRAPEYYAAVAEIGERLGDHTAVANGFCGLAIAQAMRLDFESAAESARSAAAAASRAGTPPARAAALDAEKLIAFQLGEVAELDRTTQGVLELAQTASSDGTFEHTQDVVRHQFALLESTWVPIAHGALDEARRRADAALEANRRSGMKGLEPFFLDAHTWVARAAGDSTGAVAAARAAVEAADRVPYPEQQGWMLATLGAALLENGEPEAAADVLAAGAAVSDRLGNVGLLRCSALLALARVRLGDDAGGRAAATRAQEVLRAARTPPGTALLFAGDALLALAAALRQIGDVDAAEAIAGDVGSAAERTGWWLPADQAAWLAS